MKATKYTQADIAERAGVCQATVSLVLSGSQSATILPETYERVRRVAAELGYQRPNPGSKRKARAIGYLIPALRTHEDLTVYIRRFYTGLYEELTPQKAHIIQSIEASLGEEVPEIVSQGAVDGVIIEDESDPRLVQRIQEYIPVVLLNYRHTSLSVDSCMSDNAGGIRLAMRYLYELGHRRVAIFGFDPQQLHHAERFTGYQQSLVEFDLPRREEYIAFHTPPRVFDTSQADEFSYQTLKRWMQLPEPPTAVLSLCDMHAAYLLRAARALDIAIPEQMSVIGFDNLSLCQHVEPRLTSMHQPMEDMGRYAARMLMEQITGVERPVMHLRLETNLVERESTGPAPTA